MYKIYIIISKQGKNKNRRKKIMVSCGKVLVFKKDHVSRNPYAMKV
jgi:hypothetical protein